MKIEKKKKSPVNAIIILFLIIFVGKKSKTNGNGSFATLKKTKYLVIAKIL